MHPAARLLPRPAALLLLLPALLLPVLLLLLLSEGEVSQPASCH